MNCRPSDLMKDLKTYLYDVECRMQSQELDEIDEWAGKELKARKGAEALQALGSMNTEEASIDGWTGETWAGPVGAGG